MSYKVICYPSGVRKNQPLQSSRLHILHIKLNMLNCKPRERTLNVECMEWDIYETVNLEAQTHNMETLVG